MSWRWRLPASLRADSSGMLSAIVATSGGSLLIGSTIAGFILVAACRPPMSPPSSLAQPSCRLVPIWRARSGSQTLLPRAEPHRRRSRPALPATRLPARSPLDRPASDARRRLRPLAHSWEQASTCVLPRIGAGVGVRVLSPGQGRRRHRGRRDSIPLLDRRETAHVTVRT